MITLRNRNCLQTTLALLPAALFTGLRVPRRSDRGFGVTCREDQPVVFENIRSLIILGQYPERLWS